MSEYKRLTTDKPQGNYQWLHNMTIIKDQEVYLRGSEEDINLVEFCKKECKEQCNTDIEADATEFGEYMDCDCVVAWFYHMAVGHAELRARLQAYENTGLSPEQIEELKYRYAKDTGTRQAMKTTLQNLFYWLEDEKDFNYSVEQIEKAIEILHDDEPFFSQLLKFFAEFVEDMGENYGL